MAATSKKKAAPTKKASAAKAKPVSKSKTAPAKKTKPSVAKKAAGARKPTAAKKSAATKKPDASASKKQAAVAKPQPAAKKKTQRDVLDFADFPAGSVTRHSTSLCLACIFRLFTKQLGLAPRTAYAEIRRYAPTVEELTARAPQRPFFKAEDEKNPRCPYCDAAKRWHARVDTYRVEGGKASDAARRALVKSLPTRDEQFQVHEVKKTAREVFFEWLERLGQGLDFEDDRAWMIAAARAYLERQEPKTDWAELFDGVRQVRRSQRVEEGWERDRERLYLAPTLYNDVLLVQYLVSRSHRHGGRTFEGRLTLPELVRRMRFSGHLASHGITDRDQFDVFEKLVEQLTGGGDAPAKLHFIIDRRDLLEQAKASFERQA